MNTRFTYDHFAVNNNFTLLDPIFQALLFFSIFVLVIVIFKRVPLWTCLLFACFTIIISGQLFWYSGIIVDELGLGGGDTSFYLFVSTVFTQCLIVLIAYLKSLKHKKTQRSGRN